MTCDDTFFNIGGRNSRVSKFPDKNFFTIRSMASDEPVVTSASLRVSRLVNLPMMRTRPSTGLNSSLISRMSSRICSFCTLSCDRRRSCSASRSLYERIVLFIDLLNDKIAYKRCNVFLPENEDNADEEQVYTGHDKKAA